MRWPMILKGTILAWLLMIGYGSGISAQESGGVEKGSAKTKTVPWIIAHRGGALEAPENSMAAIRRARRAGTEAVEIDVRVSADGHAVVFHDEEIAISKTTKRPVSELSLAELRKIDVGKAFDARFAGERIPTLDEVLALDWSATDLMIEVKRPGAYANPLWLARDQTLLDAVVTSLKACPDRNGLRLASFSPLLLRRLHAQFPEIPLVGIVSKTYMFAAHLKLTLSTIAVEQNLLDADLVKRFRAAKLEIWSWTQRKDEEVSRLLELGVDGIISDVPTGLRSRLHP